MTVSTPSFYRYASRRALNLLAFTLGLFVFFITPAIAAQGLSPIPRTPSTTPPKAPGSSSSRSISNLSKEETEEEDKPKASDDKPKPSTSTDGKTALSPFGSNLFMGNFLRSREDGLNPDYSIMPGDHVTLNVWGALQLSGVYVVDGQGNIFLPEVGPIHLAGVKNAELTKVVREGMNRVYTRHFDVYTNLITAKPVAVFVTGGVARPGRYAGIPSDSVLFFLDQAGGVDPNLGSYRDIQILRDEQVLTEIDLYDFILNGKIANPQFQDGDTILVRKRGPVIELRGSVAAPSLLEFKTDPVLGSEALQVVPGAARATEVTITGIRDGVPIGQTLTVNDFAKFQLRSGDSILLRDDGRPGTIMVKVEGEYQGPSVLAVRRGSRLVDVLNHIRVDKRLADVRGVHIRRPSVARSQKDSIDDALFRLERSSLLALSGSHGETDIRVREADLVQRFVEHARNIQPLGRVVTARGEKQVNLVLEEGDIIVIPAKTNVVRVSGEVFMAQAIMYTPGYSAEDYVKQAGGFTDRADESRVIIHHPNAQVVMGAPNMEVLPGDEILIPPKVDVKVMQNIMDVTQVIYQVAVSAAVIIFLM